MSNLGIEAMRDVRAKLDWASSRHDEMIRRFEEFAKPGGGDERPYGIAFEQRGRLASLVVAKFIVEAKMPTEIGLLAADLIHNARTALDHILARLKDHLGGQPGKGSFPTWQSEADWQAKVVRSHGSRNSLDGLAQPAVELIYSEQPLHRGTPAEDPLVVLNTLDNADKHRFLHQAFVYTGADSGLDLVEILDRRKVKQATNLWNVGDELEDGTALAKFVVLGDPRQAIRTRRDAPIGFASGNLMPARVGYLDLLNRVRAIADRAADLIDRTGAAGGI